LDGKDTKPTIGAIVEQARRSSIVGNGMINELKGVQPKNPNEAK
jgi:hypothetical protein